MNNIMKLFSIFVVCILQVQIALSQQNQTTTEPTNVQRICKLNINPSLCISTLDLDPRSKNASAPELALISVDATSKKVNETLEYLISVRKNVTNAQDSTKYDACIKAYRTAVHMFLPAALADLKLKSRSYSRAASEMKSVVSVSDECQAQFAGSSPLTERNKVVHDIAGMSSDFIRYFYEN
ncbi:unnamed protein product [Thlaspi arvense]|uniref:Pectinesterase inhibitor domain-containing protein n=1 Tax=Thlaspi arvense TaxID=13288 RepID=A0AAU9S2V7_THLAR|nr:unnamed protein product [Thlaspi arvense]